MTFLQPKNCKYRKVQKSPQKGNNVRAKSLSYGSYGLKFSSTQAYGHARTLCAYLTSAQCEAVRRVIIRAVRKIGHIYVRTFPYKPISKKPTKTRMGKGKGGVDKWVCPIKPGQILFEINGGISKQVAKEILEKASHKLPILTKVVGRTI